VGLGVMVVMGSNGSVERAAIAYTGVGGTPVRARDAEAQLVGQALSDEAIEAAAVTAAAATDPSADVHASAEYRKEIARVLAGRAFRKARERAGKQA
ncbi:MAG: xanthine dehydrogenase family protein subunit M, partial [Chloroflexi bacterium]|nr:xanthine dehydrogenase family protein subunit M [Chloroflexota bacterium]